jgi:outer membrane lipoprotein SlyB
LLIFEFLEGFCVQTDDMKCYSIGLCLLGAAVVLTGCETPYGTPDRTGTGALAGGAIGAFSGAVLGGRHAGEGALIGGAIGAITGGLIGHSMDQEEQERLRAEAPETYVRVEQREPLAVADVKAMVASHVSDDVIIDQVQSTHSVYHLSAADIIDLHNAGVSEKVIQYMINTPNTAGSAPPPQPDTGVVTQAPPAPPVETIVPAPDPGYVWIPGTWQWHGRWIWVGGYWAPPPHPRAVWIGGYWSRDPYGWHWVPGHWR